MSFCLYSFCPLRCLSFFDLRILITPLISSNSFQCFLMYQLIYMNIISKFSWGSLGLFLLANVLYIPPRLALRITFFGIFKCFWILAKCFKSIVCLLDLHLPMQSLTIIRKVEKVKFLQMAKCTR